MNHHLPQQARRTDGTLYEPDHRFHFGLTRYCCKCARTSARTSARTWRRMES
jgi:hypothetical protein